MIGQLRTRRLLLRRWTPADRAPFAALNADPAVVEHLPGPLSRAGSDALVERIEAGFDRHGFGLWAVELPGQGFAGFTGLSVPAFDADFLPGVEVGWRLARWAWGRGYATEAASAVLDAAFGPLALPEVLSFTASGNTRSEAVMCRLQMRRDREFDHPGVPAGSPLRRHVLYRVTAADGIRAPAAP